MAPNVTSPTFEMCILIGIFAAIIGIMEAEAIEARALMIEPPQRSSLWRFRYNTQINIADNLQNCGGYEVQWEKNGGKCGVCGDSFSGPSTHDDGGVYASGIVARSFEQGGYVNVTVEILSNLLGYFEFRLCPRNSTDVKLTQECFDTHMLWIEESWDTRYYVGSKGGIYDLHVRLPEDITCSKCVFQWKFSTGYRTGGINKCECMGCGQQEQFFNCADIEIRPRPPNTTLYERTRPNLHEPLFMLPPSASNLSQFDIQKLREAIAAFPDPVGMEMPVQFNFMSPEPFSYEQDPSKQGPGAMSSLTALDRILFSMQPGQTDIRPMPKIRGINVEPDVVTPSSEATTEQARSDTTVSPTETTSTRQTIFIPPPVVPPEVKPPPPISVTPFDVQTTTKPDLRPGLTAQRLGIPIRLPDRYEVQQPSPASNRGSIGSSITIPIFSVFPPETQLISDNGLSKTLEECTPFSPNFGCRGKGQYLNTKGIDEWCVRNCRTGNCANFMCDCDCGVKRREKRCHALGTFESIPGMDEWCTNVCAGSTCPSNVCNVDKCLRHDVR